VRLQVTREFSSVPDDCVCLGYVSGVFGVRGEVKVFLYNPKTDLFRQFSTFILLDKNGRRESVELSIRSGAGKKIIGRIKGLVDRNQAELKVGYQILFEKNKLPPLPDGEWYMHELLGLPVRTESGVSLGKITEIVEGDVDIWVAENDDEVAYIPNSEGEIVSIDMNTGVVVADYED